MSAQFWTYLGLQYLLQNGLNQSGLSKINGKCTAGSPVIEGLSSLAGLSVGQQIDGETVPDGSYILDIDASSNNITISQNATVSTLGGSTATFVVGGLYTQTLPLTIHLLTGNITPGSIATFAMQTEATYDGYAPQAVSALDTINTPPPRQFVAAQFNKMVFAPTDYAVPNFITGHCWTYTPPGASSPILVAVEVYPTAVPLQSPGDILTINPTLSLPNDCTAGVASPGIP